MNMLLPLFSKLSGASAGLIALSSLAIAPSSPAQLLDDHEPSDLWGDEDTANDEPEFTLKLTLEPINDTTALAWLTFGSPEDWHTYGPFQNDTGALPIINWQLSDGVTGQANATDWIWPIPKRHLAPGEVLDYVYYGNTSTASRLVGPSGWWKDASISLDAEWLVCDAQSCVPQFATTSDHTIAENDWRPSGEFVRSQASIGGGSATSRSRAIEAAATPTRPPLTIEANWDGDVLNITTPERVRIAYYPMLGSAELQNAASSGTSDTGKLALRFDGTETPNARGIVAVVRSEAASGHQNRAENTPAPVFIDLKKGASIVITPPE